MKRQIYTSLLLLCFCTGTVMAQEVVVSKNMYIHEGAFVGVFDNMTNQTDTLHNNGHLSLEIASLDNKVPLVGNGTLEVAGKEAQDLYGQADIKIDTLLLDNQSDDGVGFDANIYVNKMAEFENGILSDYDLADYGDPRTLFYVQFAEEAQVTNVRNQSHIEGLVKKVGTTDFIMPIGDRGYYRPAYIRASEASQLYTAKYFCCPNPFPEEDVPTNVTLQREEYWFLESTLEEFTFDISYSKQTSQFDNENQTGLSVARYDALLDHSVNIVTTSEDIEVPDPTFQYFEAEVNNSTLFKAEVDETVWYSFATLPQLEGEFPQLVTPNGDNSNDVFDVPEQYLTENNRIEIFNRYGNTVFKTNQYDNTWEGKPNQPSLGGTDGFLPSGTYYVFFYVDDKLIYKDFLQLVHSK